LQFCGRGRFGNGAEKWGNWEGFCDVKLETETRGGTRERGVTEFDLLEVSETVFFLSGMDIVNTEVTGLQCTSIDFFFFSKKKKHCN
jgi:hypothetical protein